MATNDLKVKHRKPAKDRKDEKVMVRMKPATAARLRQLAAGRDQSVSWILNDLAVRFIADQDRQAAQPIRQQTEGS